MVLKGIALSNQNLNIEQLGGKAFALAKLNEEFLIPKWFVITPQARENGKLNDHVKNSLKKELKNIGIGPYAVRSSAIDEDGKKNSFAGQFTSFLNIEANDVEDKIYQVWESASSNNVLSYKEKIGAKTKIIVPAVIVQVMVKAECAGVAFSADPVNNDTSKVSIIAVKGLADKLVSGEEISDTYFISKNKKIVSSKLVGKIAVLSDKQKIEVAELAIKAENFFGCPQDIEWAYENNKLYLLQSRPITTLKLQEKSIIWDNSNIVESYSGIVSPLTFSFARNSYTEVYKSFSLLMGVSKKDISNYEKEFKNMLGYIEGHVYYNLLSWYKILSLYPGFKINREFMEQMMGVKEALPENYIKEIIGKNAKKIQKINDILRLSRTCIRLLFNAIILKSKIRKFYKKLNTVIDIPDLRLDEKSIQELVEYYRVLENNLLNNWQTPIINDFLCMISFGISKKIITKWCKEEGENLHNEFMIGQGDIISAEPAQRIYEMAEMIRSDKIIIDKLISGDIQALNDSKKLKKSFEDYIKKFGDRCTEELKLESKTLHEDSTILLQAIGYTAIKPVKIIEKRRFDATSKINEILKEKPIKKIILSLCIGYTKSRVKDRENLRFERTRVFGRVRNIFLQIGKKLEEIKIINFQRDIFYLEVNEILGLVEGTITTYNIKELIEIRKRQEIDFNKNDDLPSRFQSTGAVLPFLERNIFSKRNENITKGEERKGLGCCSGIVKAKVRVIRDPRKESLQQGEILVAKHTDPGWIALFSNASGIIVERGSLLSHSAIVAREIGIPAIVAIDDIMDWLNTGDIVEMDGATGVVKRVINE